MSKSIPPWPTFLPPGRIIPLAAVLSLLFLGGCANPGVGAFAKRRGDEIVVAGRFVHTGTRVVTWMDPGGYDAYRVERRFSPLESASWAKSSEQVEDLESPNRYGLRASGLSEEELQRVRGGGWDLPTLRKVIDQFVVHYDVCGTSRQCFKVLHDMRGLSVHFLLDLDGTIYQTLDLKERAWHATTSNSRSVGIEIANMGAYGDVAKSPLPEWYSEDAQGNTRIRIPARFGDGGILTKDFIGRPARPGMVTGRIQGRELVQYDFTQEQYEALIKLTAALCKALPRIRCDYPRDGEGRLILTRLPDAELDAYQGLLGHFHIQTNKVDPGPAFQWDKVIQGAKRHLRGGMSEPAHRTSQGHLRHGLEN